MGIIFYGITVTTATTESVEKSKLLFSVKPCREWGELSWTKWYGMRGKRGKNNDCLRGFTVEKSFTNKKKRMWVTALAYKML